jgi:hypothetical protein
MKAYQTDHATDSVTQRPSQDFILAHQLVNTYYPDLIINNELPKEISKSIFRHIDYLRTSFPDFNQLKGKEILDVACGCRSVPDNTDHRWDPWMSRLLVLLGAVPYGIDLFEQENERFDACVLNLVEADSLARFDDDSFDAYYLSGFPNRISLQRIHNGPLGWDALRENISEHLQRILKPDGVIIRSFCERTEKFVHENISQPDFATRDLVW